MPHEIKAGTYLTVAEAADLMGCTGAYVRRLLNADRIKGGVALTDRMWLVPLDAARAAAADLTSRSRGRRQEKPAKAGRKPRKR